MKIYLIGTSNSIFKRGYSAGIAESEGVEYFLKGSMGASPSIIIPYFLSKVDIGAFDWLVIDTAINDRNYYIFNSIKARQIREFISYGITTAINAGCRPFLLLMPFLKGFGKQTVSRKIYYELSDKYYIPILDGFEFIETYATAQKLSIESCFKDEFHVLPEIAYLMGKEVVRRIKDNVFGVNFLPLKFDYRVINLSSQSREFITRINSLTRNEFVIIDDENKISINLNRNEKICGLVYNAATTFGSLRIHKKKEHIKELTTKYFNQNKKHLVIASPITHEIYTKYGNVTLSLAQDDARPTEPSRFSHYHFDLKCHRRLEIESLIVKIDES